MADETEGEDIAEDGVTEDEPRKRKLSSKKLILFVVLPAVLVLGGVAGALFSGMLGGGGGDEAEVAQVTADEAAAEGGEGGGGAAAGAGGSIFYDMPEMLVNLNTGGRSSSFLKIQVSLELSNPEAVAPIEQVLPRIVDNFQVYLRELRPDELSGSAGMYRLKEELLVRVNAAAQPAKVQDILFKEILIQ